ncbi:hypothetical protein Y032_0618g701 [Ancylostoma ceylanicum]|uniref:Uncharacterized protein n=1 Tax=Ancylostoma ceylanicum TaxID=53326 RepID=A0A016WMR8_9BILA|nr:hypothetical protein Y032_0618g701 [Ancylostoma ceylanicum]
MTTLATTGWDVNTLTREMAARKQFRFNLEHRRIIYVHCLLLTKKPGNLQKHPPFAFDPETFTEVANRGAQVMAW